ncbi:MAG TPA: thiamine diphosphokinase [candidate division Zixibacteria bacterium]|nr:thiamine diphosphokinase [candidate division Zixibacteria bacterium]
MKSFVFYLPGRYPSNFLDFYQQLSKRAFRVAVDGGLRFFIKSDLPPDLLIGDMDSVGKPPRKLLDKTEIISYPINKSKTDLELALDLCLQRGAKRIDIAMPVIGEVDHFLGVVELLRFGSPSRRLNYLERLRLINHRFEIFAIQDDSLVFRRCRGDRLSVIPVGANIRLTLTGTDYDVCDLRVRRGESHSLRNRLATGRAAVTVKGKALVYHAFGGVEL